MIKRGTTSSRLLAILVAASPLLIVLGLFSYWAIGRWSEGGAALREAALRRHEASARTSQARQYGPLGEAWRRFADSDFSGLDHSADAETALSALKTRLGGLFVDAGGALAAVQRLADGKGTPPELQHLRVEATGAAPEAALRPLLDALEGQTPYVFVELLDLKPAGEGGALKVRLRLSLYRLAEGEI